MAGIGAVASVVGTVVSAVGTIAAGQAARRDAEYQAAQLDIRAKQEFAAGQREAEEVRRRKTLALSRQQAVSGASGLGATDPGVIEIAAETAGYGQYQEQSALAAGRNRMLQNEYAASAARATGRAQETGAYFSAAGTIIGGFANAFQAKYGNGGYRSPTASVNYGGYL